MKESNNQERILEEITNCIESYGYSITNPEALHDAAIPQASENSSATEIMLRATALNENVLDMPHMYEDLVEFVDQLSPIQYHQLKPLLFAFFYRTVIELHRENPDVATEFFEKYTKDNPDGTRPFHCFHDSDIKKLQQYLMASSFTQTNSLDKTVFATQLTETTYQALFKFLMDKSYNRFLLILNNYINVIHVPLDHFTSDFDKIPGFIYKSTEQAEQPSVTLTTLLKNNPYDMAKRFLGEECNFEFFDDDKSIRMPNPFQYLPPIVHEKILSVALDIQNMAHLSKSVLPSCAYFTFNDDNLAYDINGPGTLLAAATERNYVKLFSTNVNTDLDDELKFGQIRSMKNHLLVPRFQVGREQNLHHCMRTLIGPRSYCLRFSPESRFLLTGCNNGIRLYSCETTGIVGTYDVPCGITWSCDWSPLGYHFVTASDDSCAWLWAIDRPKPLRLFVHHQEPLTDIKYHPNALTLATSSYDRSIMLWDIRCQGNSNPFTKIFLAESVAVPNVIQFTRNGRVLISGDEFGKISTWDIGEGRTIGSVKAHKGSVVDLAVSVEGTILASTGIGGEVLLWDMGTLCSTASASGSEYLKKLQPRKAQTHRLAFSNRNLLHAIGSIKKDDDEQFPPNGNGIANDEEKDNEQNRDEAQSPFFC